MEFTSKVQAIVPVQKIPSSPFVFAHEFQVSDEDVLKKRGKLFIVGSITVSDKFDIKTLADVFLDHVREWYYRQNDDTPLHAIESALQKSAQTLRTIKSRDETIQLSADEAKFRITYAAAVVWNSVLYASYVGSPAVYLLRGSGARNLATHHDEADIWTSSSVLSEHDVLVLGTDRFAELFPPNEISSALGSLSRMMEENASDKSAALLIKISAEKKPVNHFLPLSSAVSVKNTVSQSFWKLKNKIIATEALSERFKLYQNKKTAPVSSISSLIGGAQKAPLEIDTAVRTKPRRIGKQQASPRKKIVAFVAGIFVLTGLIYLNIAVFRNQKENRLAAITATSPTPQSSLTGGEPTPVLGTSDKKTPVEGTKWLDVNKIGRETPIVDMSSQGTSTVFLLTAQALYQTTFSNPAPKRIVSNLQNAKYVSCAETLCAVFDGAKVLVFDPKTPTKQDTYAFDKGEDVLDIELYAQVIYFLTPKNIYKLVLLEDEVKPWLAENTRMESPLAFVIDSRILVLEGTTVRSYLSGAAQSKSVVQEQLLRPVNLAHNENYLAILMLPQEKEKQIAVVDLASGKVVNTHIIAESGSTEKIAHLTILDDQQKTILYQKGNAVYSISALNKNANVPQ